MRKNQAIMALLLLFAIVIAPLQAGVMQAAAATEQKKLIYDEAGLLSQEDYNHLNALANEYGAKRETDFIIFTSSNTANTDVVKLTEDFYDNNGPGYDKTHGNTAILTLDMRNRDVYLAGFYKAEDYLDDGRLDKIRAKITPDLSAGDYRAAFEKFIKTSHRYMGFRPGVNPDNPLFNGWIQLAIAAGLGAAVVGMMAYHSGGRVTVNHQTYEDGANSGILDRQDQYIRTTVTKRKIEKNNGGGGKGGGGGGISGGGHSHSGSRGSF